MLVGGSNVQSNRLPFVTLFLVVINVGIFIHSYTLEVQAARESRSKGMAAYFDRSVQNSMKDNQALENFYKEYGFSVQDFTERKEYYSIVTHMFVHGGLMHLVGNMLMLWGVGVGMESALGSRMYCLYYFVCGLAAALAQGLTSMALDIPTIGASGAIAGLMGGFFILFGADAKLKVLVWIGFIPKVFQIPALLFAVIWMAQQLLGSAMGGVGVAWMAHIGGLIAGGGLALAFKGSLKCEIETDRDGNVQIKHDDSPEATDAELFEQVLDLHPVKVVVEEVLGSDAQVFCPKCTASLDLSQQIGDRLIRCCSCGEIAYIDGNLIVRSQAMAAQQKLTEATV